MRERLFRGKRKDKGTPDKPHLTPKGIAVLAAIEAELLPRVEGGWDNTKFDKFWELYEAEFNKNFIIVRKEKEKEPLWK